MRFNETCLQSRVAIDVYLNKDTSYLDDPQLQEIQTFAF